MRLHTATRRPRLPSIQRPPLPKTRAPSRARAVRVYLYGGPLGERTTAKAREKGTGARYAMLCPIAPGIDLRSNPIETMMANVSKGGNPFYGSRATLTLRIGDDWGYYVYCEPATHAHQFAAHWRPVGERLDKARERFEL